MDSELQTDSIVIQLADGVVNIPRSELDFRTSRSSGAGGQHVNKTSSRVEISWNIVRSEALTDEQRKLLMTRLASRISEEGAVRVVASDTRSQLRNRQTAEQRLADLIAKSLTVQKKRRPTKQPRAANEARLTEKKKHSDKKREQTRRGVESSPRSRQSTHLGFDVPRNQIRNRDDAAVPDVGNAFHDCGNCIVPLVHDRAKRHLQRDLNGGTQPSSAHVSYSSETAR